jgi:hypothetical protein
MSDDRSGLSLVIQAAGIGRRFGGLKQLEPVGPSGESLIDYAIYDAMNTGFERIVLVVRAETEATFRETIGARVNGRVQVEYVQQRLDDLPNGAQPPPERAKPWGTGQAVLACGPVVDGPFMVVNADDFYGADAYSTISRFLTEDSDPGQPTWAMAGYAIGRTLPNEGTVSRGLCRTDADEWLTEIVEILEISRAGKGARWVDGAGEEQLVSADQPVSMNCWGFTNSIFGELEHGFRAFLESSGESSDLEFILPEVVQASIAAGRARVKILPVNGTWCGLTNPEDSVRVAAFIGDLVVSGAYPKSLWG